MNISNSSTVINSNPFEARIIPQLDGVGIGLFSLGLMLGLSSIALRRIQPAQMALSFASAACFCAASSCLSEARSLSSRNITTVNTTSSLMHTNTSSVEDNQEAPHSDGNHRLPLAIFGFFGAATMFSFCVNGLLSASNGTGDNMQHELYGRAVRYSRSAPSTRLQRANQIRTADNNPTNNSASTSANCTLEEEVILLDDSEQ